MVGLTPWSATFPAHTSLYTLLKSTRHWWLERKGQVTKQETGKSRFWRTSAKWRAESTPKLPCATEYIALHIMQSSWLSKVLWQLLWSGGWGGSHLVWPIRAAGPVRDSAKTHFHSYMKNLPADNTTWKNKVSRGQARKHDLGTRLCYSIWQQILHHKIKGENSTENNTVLCTVSVLLLKYYLSLGWPWNYSCLLLKTIR